MRGSSLLWLVVPVTALAVFPGCQHHKEQAVAELAKIDAACAKQDTDSARQIMLDAARSNPLFGEAFEGAKTNWKVTDEARMNPCGIFLADLKRRIGGK